MMRIATGFCLLFVAAGCCPKADSTAELARVRRERDEYAARLEESETLLRHTRWQLAEVKKALNDMQTWRAAATRNAPPEVVRQHAPVKVQDPLPPPPPPGIEAWTVEQPPPNWRDLPEWHEAVMKHRYEQAKKRAEERRARTRPTTQ